MVPWYFVVWVYHNLPNWSTIAGYVGYSKVCNTNDTTVTVLRTFLNFLFTGWWNLAVRGSGDHWLPTVQLIVQERKAICPRSYVCQGLVTHRSPSSWSRAGQCAVLPFLWEAFCAVGLCPGGIWILHLPLSVAFLSLLHQSEREEMLPQGHSQILFG